MCCRDREACVVACGRQTQEDWTRLLRDEACLSMMSSMPLGKQARALASNPEPFASQTHVGKHAQMQHALSRKHVNPFKRYGKHT